MQSAVDTSLAPNRATNFTVGRRPSKYRDGDQQDNETHHLHRQHILRSITHHNIDIAQNQSNIVHSELLPTRLCTSRTSITSKQLNPYVITNE